ncbi:class I SAM-dependent RNA methyltransferase [Breznakiella homolactica]|uniref:Class I SAM-dependent RNA methyltransferase n=1 Tax=Breznakiella homolactica TaxID=2798577 RepID=A0A7T8B937_9SPIR|nr:class I SAM-dependent RNA methyltransferase [Breznakiella homolactica]QQO07941.1 class I SAM-dependent RNA methyltransferase [Breznakiella homolactica]
MKSGDFFTAPVESLAAGGSGVLHHNGKTFFMDYTVPGDTVTGRIIGDSGSWGRAELVDLHEASPGRTEPVCGLFGKCGGCSLQHMEYGFQLEGKQSVVRDAFARIGGFPELPAVDIVPSSPLGYRNRMQFHRVPAPKPKFPPVGLKEKSGTGVVPLADCPIADSGIRNALQNRDLIPPPDKDRFTVYSREGILLREGGTARGSVSLAGKTITMDAGIFFQSNGEVLEKLVRDLVALAQRADPDLPAADVYAGVGTFSVFLRDRFGKIDLIEGNPAALAIARENLRGTDFGFYALRDDHWAKQQTAKKKNPPYGFMVLDPPREGLAPPLSLWLSNEGPALAAYVSCNPVTMARDARTLAAGGYRLTELRLYDFYPQTAHIECLGVFERTPGGAR